MSKLDAQRAMREAAYAARQAGTSPTRGTAKKSDDRPPVAPPTTPTPRGRSTAAPSAAPAAEVPDASTETCGHRSMNGRTCTRPAGHSEKNHRYS